nr:hypothetical protein [Tanacetum cinerariifolium]
SENKDINKYHSSSYSNILSITTLTNDFVMYYPRLKFGVENWADYNDEDKPIPFRRRVFSSSLDGKPIKGNMVLQVIKSKKFNELHDDDAVSLCCVGILQLVSLGVEDRRAVPNWILRLANDRDRMYEYP